MRPLTRMLLLVLAVGIPALAFGNGVDLEPDTFESLANPEDGRSTPAPTARDRDVESVVDDLAEATPEPTPDSTTAPTSTATPLPAASARPATPQPAARLAVRARATPRPTPKPARAAAPSRTAAPSPTVTAEPTATPNSTYDREAVKREIRSAWRGDEEAAIQVVGCETAWTYDPRTLNSAGPYYGLWQVTQGTWESYGGTGDPRDASATRQTQVAWRLYSDRGWAPWPGCSPESSPDPTPGPPSPGPSSSRPRTPSPSPAASPEPAG